MEGGDGPNISIKPNTIKAAQEEMGRLDVLVCGQCHSVFHFIDEFQEHRSKEGACSKVSNFRENSNNEQKAQVWAFLLWKDTQIHQESPDKDKDTNSWKLYKKWCQMDTHVRDCWITAGKTIQTFTKISNAKMQDVPRQQGNITTEGGKTLVVRKVIRNGQPESPDKKEFKSESKMRPDIKSKEKLKPSKSDSNENNVESSDEEYVVEKILAKRFNPKKKVYEYLLKWEGYAHEHNTWEEVSQVSKTCKILMDDFEKNLAIQKEIKAQQVAKSIGKTGQLTTVTKIVKVDSAQAGPSSESGRPMRSSKSKALHQVKQWCGTMKDEDNETVLGKRKIAFSDSDSDEEYSIKRTKVETSGDDDWAADSEEDKAGRSDVIQRAFIRATAQSNGSNRPLTGSELTNSMLANAKGVKVEQKQSNSPSNVYIVHRKDGIIKLDSSPTNKIAVKGTNQQGSGGVLMVQNRDGSGNIVKSKVLSSANSITPVKVMTKSDGTQVVTQMKVVPKVVQKGKNEPIKIQPKPDPNQVQQIQIVTAIPSPLVQSQRVTTATRPTAQRTMDGRPLLPRPPNSVRGTTPTTTGLMTITQTRSPVRAPPPRHLTPQGTQRQGVQNRSTPSTAIQVSSPSATTTIRPKITVMNQQGKVVQKTVVSPINVTRPPPKATTPINKNQATIITAQQKVFAARDKLAKEAGVKTSNRGGSNAKGAGRGRGAVKVDNTACNKPKESKLANTDGLHMEFHAVESEESSSDEEPDFPPLPSEPVQRAAPDSPPREFSLCPLTGRIIGPDGQPVDQPEAEQSNPAVTTSMATPMAIIQASTAGTATITPDGIITAHSSENAELVLPNLESLTDGSGGMVRVEMSPGGTIGTIVQANETAPITLSSAAVPGPDLPCLDDPTIEVQTTSTGGVLVNVPPISIPDTTVTTTASSELTEAPAATITVTTTSSAPLVEVTTAVTTSMATDAAETTIAPVTSDETIIPDTNQEPAAENQTAGTLKMEENAAGLVTITGEDGVVYQVTGQNEDGQLVITRDGEQQCVYVTTDQQNEDGSVLTIDHAVAEAVAQLMPGQIQQQQQYYVKEGTDGTVVESTETTAGDNQQIEMSIMDNSDAVVAANQQQGENENLVAQVIQADEPTPGGTRRVVLLLPDGNLMMTEVDEEQYAALELDK